MSVKIRRYRKGGWDVDIHVVTPDGRSLRERRRAKMSSKSAAKRWAEGRERVFAQLPLHEIDVAPFEPDDLLVRPSSALELSARRWPISLRSLSRVHVSVDSCR